MPDVEFHCCAKRATVRKVRDQYVLRWMLDGEASDLSMTGTAMRSGNVLAVGWARPNVVGVSVFKIQPDGVLAGKWVQWRTADGKQESETLTWEKDFAPVQKEPDTKDE